MERKENEFRAWGKERTMESKNMRKLESGRK